MKLKQDTCACYEDYGKHVWRGCGPEKKLEVALWEFEFIQEQVGATGQEVGTEEGAEDGDPPPILIDCPFKEEFFVGHQHDSYA